MFISGGASPLIYCFPNVVIRETEPRSRGSWSNQGFRNTLTEGMPQGAWGGSVWKEARLFTILCMALNNSTMLRRGQVETKYNENRL